MGNDPSVPFIQLDWDNFEILMRVSDLADCLMHRWPIEGRGEDYLTALMVCHEVLRGSEDDTAEQARSAFVAAAHEVGLSVIPDDDIKLDF